MMELFTQASTGLRFNRYIVEYKLVTINNPVVCAMDLMKDPNPPAMLGRIV